MRVVESVRVVLREIFFNFYMNSKNGFSPKKEFRLLTLNPLKLIAFSVVYKISFFVGLAKILIFSSYPFENFFVRLTWMFQCIMETLSFFCCCCGSLHLSIKWKTSIHLFITSFFPREKYEMQKSFYFLPMNSWTNGFFSCCFREVEHNVIIKTTPDYYYG